MGSLTKVSTANPYSHYEVGKYRQWDSYSGASWDTICYSTYSFNIDEPSDSLKVHLSYSVMTYSNTYRFLIDDSETNVGSLSVYDGEFGSGSGVNPSGQPSEQGWRDYYDENGKNFIINKRLNAGTHYLHIVCTTSSVGAIDISESKSYVNVEALRTYEVSYDANGGSGAPSSQFKTYDEALTLSANKPTKESVSSNGYTVTFDANKGLTTKTESTAIDTTKYTFKSWNTFIDGSGKSYNSGDSYTEDKDIMLYAQYESGLLKGSVMLPTEDECTRIGYTLLGFNTSGNESDPYHIQGGSYTPTANVTLYAVWKPNGCAHIANNSGEYEMYQIYIANNDYKYELYMPYIYNNDGVWIECV